MTFGDVFEVLEDTVRIELLQHFAKTDCYKLIIDNHLNCHVIARKEDFVKKFGEFYMDFKVVYIKPIGYKEIEIGIDYKIFTGVENE